MCGRFTLFRLGEYLKRFPTMGAPDDVPPSWNIAPGQNIPVVLWDQDSPSLCQATWGFSAAGRAPIINARGETADRLPMFRESAGVQPCLVPCDGFYEWGGEPRFPWYFSAADGAPMSLAGLCRPAGQGRQVAILTTTPNKLVAALHDRMPAICLPGHEVEFLAGRLRPSAVGPAAPEVLRMHRVDPRMNRPSHNTAACMAPWAPPAQLF